MFHPQALVYQFHLAHIEARIRKGGEIMGRTIILREAGGIGDILCSLVSAKALAEAGDTVEYAVLSGYAEIVCACPFVSKVYPVDRRRRGRDEPITPAYLAACGIDHRGAKLVDHWCPAWRHEWATGGKPWLNRIEAFWQAAGLPVGALPDNPLSNLLVMPEQAPGGLPQRFGAVQHETMDNVRDVPCREVGYFVERAHREGLEVVGFGLKHPSGEVPYDKFYPEMTFPQLFTLIRHAERLLCGDSGPLHISNIYGTPTEAWFGPTSGRLICRQYKNVEVHQGKGCAPCYYNPAKGWKDCRNNGGCKAFSIPSVSRV